MKQVQVNGEILQFPDSMSDEEIKAVLREKFPPEQAQAQEPTLGQRLGGTVFDPSTGGMAGALAGAALGAPGGPAGMLAGGALGAFAGGGAGELSRQMYAGEEFQPLRAAGAAAFEGSLEAFGAKAVDAIVTVGSGAKKLITEGPSALLGRFADSAPVNPREQKLLEELQVKLEQQGTTLRPSQMVPDNTALGMAEATAESSVGGSPALRTVAERQNQYLETATDDMVKTLTNSNQMNRESLGVAVKEIIKNARAATRIEFKQRFTDLDKLGKGVTLSIRGLQTRTRNAMAQDNTALLSQAARKRGDRLKFLSDSRLDGLRKDILKLPPNVTFSAAYDIVQRINRKIDQVYDAAKPNDPIIVDLLKVKKSLQAQMRVAAQQDPQLASAFKSLMADYNKTQNVLYSDTAVSLLRNNQPEEAGRLLASPGMVTQPKMLAQIIAEAQRVSAKGVSSPVMDGLRKGFLEQTLRAADSGVTTGKSPFTTVESLTNQLNDPRFSDTFNLLFGQQGRDVAQKLIDEANILSRGVGGELALSVRSRQLGAATGALRPDRSIMDRISDIIVLRLPDELAKLIADPKVANRVLNGARMARKQFEQEGKISAKTIAEINGGLVALGINAQIEANSEAERREMAELIEQITKGK